MHIPAQTGQAHGRALRLHRLGVEARAVWIDPPSSECGVTLETVTLRVAGGTGFYSLSRGLTVPQDPTRLPVVEAGIEPSAGGQSLAGVALLAERRRVVAGGALNVLPECWCRVLHDEILRVIATRRLSRRTHRPRRHVACGALVLRMTRGARGGRRGCEHLVVFAERGGMRRGRTPRKHNALSLLDTRAPRVLAAGREFRYRIRQGRHVARATALLCVTRCAAGDVGCRLLAVPLRPVDGSM